MLSNTATPKYYGEFRARVMAGEIPVCREISMEMNRIDDLIANPGIYYDDEAVQGFIDFCEEEMTLSDGSDFHMLDTFKLWAEQVFGWYYYVTRSVYVPNEKYRGGKYVNKRTKKRLVNVQYIILGRGGSKSMYDSCIQSFWLNVDKSRTSQIAVSPTMRQTEEGTMAPIKTAIVRAKGPLFKFLTWGSLQNTTGARVKRTKLAATKKGIENFLTSSIIEVYPMSIDKLQGLRCKVATVDEWLSGETRESPITAIEQGAAKNDDYLIVATSSEGTVRNGVGDAIKMELMKILRGERVDPHVSIWYYRLDDVKEVSNPEMWVKAQPNIGKTVSYETYQREVEKAESDPSVRNEILAKRFGIPMEGYTYFFTYEQTKVHPRRDFWKMSCAMGMDASQGDDFFSITFLFPLPGGEFGVKTRNYISSRTMYRLPGPLRTLYEEFMQEGSLVVLEGDVIDTQEVYEDIQNLIDERQYDVCAFGYDPYNARAFVEQWCRYNGDYGVEKVPQGSRTESVPLGEIRKLAADRKLLFDEHLVQFTMGNCITIEDTNGNRKLLKKRYENKIDAVAALMDAYVAYKLHKEAFE